ncbi:hypothetical protein HDU97_001433 [Phlyctochytrium planicorne]|nr:hypothetical protein HDU97_001433 [Phlyctochytrium planicorne]
MNPQPRQHQIFFTIPPADRPLVARWLSDVRKFFSTKGALAADLTRYFNGAPSGGQNLLSTQQLRATDLNHLDDLLEGMTVHYAVHLTSVLGHYSEDIRVNAVFLLFELACIFDKRAIELKKKLGKITLGFQVDDKGFHNSVHELFHYIGPALNSMAIAFVAGLECFFTCIDWSVRSICISALTRLVYENEKVFLEEDHLSAIYNLYFSLGSIPLLSKIFPDRIVIIKALGLLSGLYALADTALTGSIIQSLLRLKDKTILEIDALKSTLKKIFERLSEAQGSNQAASSDSKAVGYNVFSNLISPNDEDSYDLLPWALETFSLAIASAYVEEKGKKVIGKEYPPLTEFVKSLTNHFRANPALVRYGACICLHASLTVFPSFVQINKQILVFIISGVLDTDYLSSFLYLTMLDTFSSGYSKSNIKELVAELRHEAFGKLDYDMLYASQEAKTKADVQLSEILDKAVEIAPSLAPKLLHKLINSLEFLPKALKLRQMELIRVWGRKLEKFDTYAMQTLVPLLNDDDEDIRLCTVKILKSIMPTLASASPADISFIWSYFSGHLKLKTNALLNTLTRLAFSKDSEVRLAVYDLIGTSGEFWKVSSLFNAALGVLFLFLGDQNPKCAKKVIDYLCSLLQGTKFTSLIVPLGIMRDCLEGTISSVIKGYDDLANFMEKNRNDLEDLIATVTHESNIDEFWFFFLEDAPENQLVRPDDYSYIRNFIHMPFWISILMVKLSVPPPPAPGSETSRRNMMPVTPANKRRFVIGFLLCLLPTCGMPDPILRRSALEILTYIVRIKLPGISPAILLQYLDLALDVAFNSPSSVVKVGALELIEVFLLVFPAGVGTKLQDIRDVVRALIVDAEQDVVSTACRIYPLVFKCVPSNNIKDFHDYLRDEIMVIQKGGLEAASDPLISGLSREEIERMVLNVAAILKFIQGVLCLSIFGLGSISSSSSAYMIVQELLRLTKVPSAPVRLAALNSILSQMRYLDTVESSTIIWIVLPLYADPSQPVRLAFSKYLRKIPTAIELLTKSLPAHPDDGYILNSTTWEDLLMDGAVIPAGTKNLNDVVYDITDFLTSTDSGELPAEDIGFHLPTVSEKLLSRFKVLAKELTGIIPSMNVNEVLYHLQELQKNTDLQPNAILVMSELGVIHEAIQNDVADLLISNLNHEIRPDNRHLIEASILGLKNLSEYSPPMLKQMIIKITTPSAVHEGDIVALLYRVDSIKEFCANKAPEICKKYHPIILSQRQPVRKRLWAIHLNVELSLTLGEEEIGKTLDSIQVFLDTTDEEDMKEKVYGSLSKLAIKNKDPVVRLRSLAIFKIFAKHLGLEEAMQFCFLFLADSNREIRRKARELIAVEGLLDFALPVLKSAKPIAGSRRAVMLETCKLPSIQRLGITINTNTMEEAKLSIPLVEMDPFNIKYYASDRRRKFTDRFGILESKFTRVVLPMTISVMEAIEERTGGSKKYHLEMLAKYQWLLNIDTITILHECMKRFPQVAAETIESSLDEAETVVKNMVDVALDDTFEDAGDIEAEIHLIDTLSNLIFGFDGIDDKVPGYIDRLQNMINSCNQKAVAVRESLYMDLENSFYFFNEFIDVPIVSEEQFTALEKFKTSTQEATLEMVKSGKTDKLSSLDAQKTEISDVIDLKSEQLRKLTIVALHCTSGYGLYHALTLVATDARLITAIQFLADMLENEHRGIRMAAVEAINTITKIQLELSLKPTLLGKIQELTTGFLARLKGNDSFSLYRRRADIINLMAQLIGYVNDRTQRVDVLEQLLRYWKDPDSEVRTIAIKMLQHLGESGMPEVIEGFRIGNDGKNAPEHSPPDIMREIAAFLSNPEYSEKDHLNNLLAWRFSEGKAGR